MDKIYDVIIVGSGPAGMTAALYGSRAGLSCALIESNAPGGKLIKTFEISNYPSVKESSGVELAMSMFDHSTSFGAEFVSGEVVDIIDGDVKKVTLDDGSIVSGLSVIIATGTKERLMNIPNEKELTGKGVSYCAVCDGAFFKDKVVTVIGGGNSALEESLYLAQFASQVNIVIRRDVFRAEPIIQDRIEKESKINVIKKHVPKAIVEKDGKVGAIVLENVDTKETMEIDTAAVFPYIGLDPITDFAKKLGVCNEQGYIVVNEHMETSVKGIYGVGDCRVTVLRQVITACSDGAIAAQRIFHQLKG